MKNTNLERLQKLKLSLIIASLSADGGKPELSAGIVYDAITAVVSDDSWFFENKYRDRLVSELDHQVFDLVSINGDYSIVDLFEPDGYIAGTTYISKVLDFVQYHGIGFCFWGDVSVSPESDSYQYTLASMSRPIYFKPILLSKTGFVECGEGEDPVYVIDEFDICDATSIDNIRDAVVLYRDYKDFLDPP